MASRFSGVKSHSFFTLLAAGLLPAVLHATDVHGRLELGLLTSTERFAEESSGSDKNDQMVGSFRSDLRVSNIGSGKWQFNSDIRDKYDLFDKLNKEKLQLDPANTFQVRELNFRKPVEESQFAYTLGRFSVPEAGNSYADGLQLVKDFNRSWNIGAYGGLNPKIYGQSALNWNQNANTYGAYFSYQAPNLGWDRNFYITHAYVTEAVDSLIDRRFLFHSMNFQYAQNSRFMSLVYLDFVPKTYVQMGNLYWQQEFSKYFYTKLSGLAVDTIQYVHIQNIREQLASSPYKEGSLKLDLRTSALTTWELSGLSGKRESDNLSKSEYRLSVASQRSFGPKWDTDFHLGHRNNFVSDDDFARIGLGYYARLWEVAFDLEYGTEKNRTTGVTLHPLVVEASIARLFSREFFGTWSVERAADERVVIISSFLKFGYRYGNKEMAPLRDGSPVKGPL